MFKEKSVGTHAKKKGPQVYNGVSEADVPSAKWGWSELSPATIQIAGWISVFFLVMLNFGNHRGHVETIYLIGFAVFIALGLILFAIRPQLNQVRTLTAHNKPVGHQERDWAYEQHTLTGIYENLNDETLRAMNIEPSRVRAMREAIEPQTTGSASVNPDNGRHAVSSGVTVVKPAEH